MEVAHSIGLIIIGISIVSCVVCWLYGILDRYADKVFSGLLLPYMRTSDFNWDKIVARLHETGLDAWLPEHALPVQSLAQKEKFKVVSRVAHQKGEDLPHTIILVLKGPK